MDTSDASVDRDVELVSEGFCESAISGELYEGGAGSALDTGVVDAENAVEGLEEAASTDVLCIDKLVGDVDKTDDVEGSVDDTGAEDAVDDTGVEDAVVDADDVENAADNKGDVEDVVDDKDDAEVTVDDADGVEFWVVEITDEDSVCVKVDEDVESVVVEAVRVAVVVTDWVTVMDKVRELNRETVVVMAVMVLRPIIAGIVAVRSDVQCRSSTGDEDVL